MWESKFVPFNLFCPFKILLTLLTREDHIDPLAVLTPITMGTYHLDLHTLQTIISLKTNDTHLKTLDPLGCLDLLMP